MPLDGADGYTNAGQVTQERFDAQAITLRLTKEQCGDLQVSSRLSAFVGFVDIAVRSIV